MNSPLLTLGSLAVYLLCLLALGYFIDKKMSRGQVLITNHALLYSLSLTVYCTTWTFYGSIGNALGSGLLFSTIYIGPTIGAIFWWPILRKLIRIKNHYRITSIIDFISARYNKSVGIGVLLTIFVVIGFIPYNALQIKSIMLTTALMLSTSPEFLPYYDLVESAILVVVIIFTIFFGLRTLNPTESHPGMISALAIESIIKLIATIAGGIFIVYFLSNGVKDLLQSVPEILGTKKYPHMVGGDFKEIINFVSWTILASAAVIFLPRQFHISVIENVNEEHVKTAQWVFPLYLLTINLFVLPIALYSLKHGISGNYADSILIELPLAHQQHWLALFIYIGGFSAGIGMITVSVMTISTMVTNHLLLPALEIYPKISFLRARILESRWIAAALIIILAYFYQRYIGSGEALVAMGMISFVAAFQFVPPILLGLFWSKSNSRGAFIGIFAGCFTWAYTLFFPAFVKSGFFSDAWLKQGPFGIALLKPEALLGFEGLTSISHSFLWTTLLNVGGIILGSLLFKTSNREKIHADEFLSFDSSRATVHYETEIKDIVLASKVKLISDLLTQYFGPTQAEKILRKCTEEAQISGVEKISISQLADLNFFVERALAGVIGSAAANQAIRNSNVINKDEEKNLSKIFAQMLSNLHVSPIDFKKKVDFQLEKSALLNRQKKELELRLAQQMKEVQKMQERLVQSSKMSALGEMAGGIAHEINTPLAIIQLTLEQMKKVREDGHVEEKWTSSSIEILLRVTARIAAIVKGLRTFSSSDENLPFESKTLNDLIDEVLALCQEKFRSNGIELKVQIDKSFSIYGRPVQLSQVILNVLNNAYDAVQGLPQKWIQIDAKESGPFIELSITDSGAGIPPAIADKIMQPFFTTKGLGNGTGLGLSISSGIINAHGGELLLDKKSTHTRFIIRLPKT